MMNIVLIGRTKVLAAIGRECIDRAEKVVAIVTASESAETKNDFFEIENFARLHEIPIFSSPNLGVILRQLRELGPIDIGLSVNYVSVLSKDQIDVFRLGVLNAHGGDLPRYRGNACQAWAILNGERSIALCIHQMVGGSLDSGDIIAREYFSLSEQTYIGDVYNWMSSRIPELMLYSAQKLNTDSSFCVEKQSVDPSDSLRTYPRLPEDGRIVWRSSTVEILRLIRASSLPFSGAFAMLGDARITIWKANEVRLHPFNSVPGQILGIGNDWFDVSVDDGSSAIRVTHATLDSGEDWKDAIKSIRTRLR
jgi:methionyl-tRNA formyltransferase